MIGWHHRLDGHEFEQAPEVGEGQGSLACCSPWGHKESDTMEQLNNNNQNNSNSAQNSTWDFKLEAVPTTQRKPTPSC